MLIARFGILWRQMKFSLSRVPAVLAACMRVHNYCIDNKVMPMRSAMSTHDRDILDMASNKWWEAATSLRDQDQGRRRDLESSHVCDHLTAHLKELGFFRPS